MLQCADTNLPGYLPSELMRGQNKNELQVPKFACIQSETFSN